MSPAWYSCISASTKSQSESTSKRCSRVHQSGISTAISNASSYLAQLNMTSAIYQPRSAELRHIWCRCMSPARYSCISAATNFRAKVLLGVTAMSTRAVSIAIIKTKTYLAQLYINRDPQSKRISELYTKRKLKMKAQALLGDTAVSTRVVYQPRTARQNNLWRS